MSVPTLVRRLPNAVAPLSGEFFAPLPLLMLALMVVNDVWLKPAFHSELTGKLSDVAVCFVMPLFVSELLGIVLRVRAPARLLTGALVTGALFTALEIVPPFTRVVVHGLDALGPCLGIRRRFRMTSDWTDLYCLVVIPLAFAYGSRRIRSMSVEPTI
jgi:hypothetical protein